MSVVQETTKGQMYDCQDLSRGPVSDIPETMENSLIKKFTVVCLFIFQEIDIEPYYMNMTGYVNEDVFENYTIYMLGAGLRANTTCSIVLTQTEAAMLYNDFRQEVVSDGGGIDLHMLQEVLESFVLIGNAALSACTL